MGHCHEEVVVADHCFVPRVVRAVNSDVLAQHVSAADPHARIALLVREMLRFRADNRAHVNLVVFADGCLA
jgi:hypothetical protein